MTNKKIHLIGIGGINMSAIALLLKTKNNIVSGSDKYIKNINNLIEQCYDKKNYNIKIINCYEVRDNEDLGKIISENGYTQILNTKGECDIKKTVL